MRKSFVLLFLLLLSYLGYGQKSSVISDLMATSSDASYSRAENQFNHFVEKLQRRKTASDIGFLKTVFHQTEKTFLKTYVPYSEFSEVFNTGNYDCLTATSLFAHLLDQLNFTYRIVETNYHIFLLVKTSKGE